MCLTLSIAALIVLLIFLVLAVLIALGERMIDATIAKESWKAWGERDTLTHNLSRVPDVWYRAWKLQISRMKSHPGEIEYLSRNAQISQACYVMALAEEAIKVRQA